MKKEQGFATRAIHAGQQPDPTTGAVMTPIYATSTYVQESPGKHKGYDYARSINPTRLAYEKCIADLESGTRGFAFASGLAAMATVLELLDSGSHVVASDDLYGGTFRLFDRVRRRPANLDFTYVDLTDAKDLEGGVVVVGENKELGDQIAFLQNAVGAIAGAFDSFLVLRSLKTLALRMERHCANALEIARWLEEQGEVKSVHYPGLKSHPQHDLARQQMRGFGGMVTIVLKTDLAGTRRFLENTELFALAESLGGVESLINHPALMTHASVPKEKREALGVTDSLVRLSVGVEDVRDLIDDLKFALEAI